MGAEPYWYYVNYKADIDAALQELRQREFEAGRYNPVIPFLNFPIGPDAPSPGAQHSSIEEALEAAQEDGTCSILDLERVSSEPDFCVAAPLEERLLRELYGTSEPTREMVAGMDFLEDLDRGHGVYLTLFKNGAPDEILFAGLSFD